ncbi:hypothetical protein AVEN_178369-1 [Araneus ventricosus]|uniref:Uncharacterized protein n=1 Tax=Araneus ventricosus TaxID=182803 RepID=A0A4Y2BD67_ARAVE|nr:hypothetical protein AVEN_178369-1 [Araneus ventricosus]
MSKHSRARRHHPLLVTDPRWATPTPDPTGPLKTPTLPGGQKYFRRPHWAFQETSTWNSRLISHPPPTLLGNRHRPLWATTSNQPRKKQRKTDFNS